MLGAMGAASGAVVGTSAPKGRKSRGLALGLPGAGSSTCLMAFVAFTSFCAAEQRIFRQCYAADIAEDLDQHAQMMPSRFAASMHS